MFENPTDNNLPAETTQNIIQQLHSCQIFRGMSKDKQIYHAKLILEDPRKYVARTLKSIENGLGQGDPKLNQAKLLLDLIFKVAVEFCQNDHWLISKIGNCYAIICPTQIEEVRTMVKKVLESIE